MIDSYAPETMERMLDPILERMLDDARARPSLGDVTLTAMGAYLRAISAWEPRPPAVPTLLLQATEPMTEAPPTEEWRADWTHSHEIIEVPGSHLTVLDDHAEMTARAIEDWLAVQTAAARPPRRPAWRAAASRR